MAVSTHVVDGWRVISLANPPVNAISVGKGVVSALEADFTDALADEAIRGVVITAEGRLFSGGADIADFDSDLDRLDRTRRLNDAIELSPKPVIAALNGSAMGGGLELALAAHYRVAARGAALSLPEVTLGLLPGGGGTQRLPRLIGADEALAMMIGGKPVDAEQALAQGLIDAIADGDLIACALELARSKSGQGPRRTRDLPARPLRTPPPTGKSTEAARAIRECVEAAAERPFDDGCRLEKALFDKLARSEASAGLRHVFFSRRKTGDIPDFVRPAQPLSIHTVAVVGGGLMGGGITNAVLNAGLPVVLVEPAETARDRARAGIGQAVQRDVDKGRISQEQAQQRLSALTVTGDLAEIGSADLIIEAVFEDVEVKRSVLGEMDRRAKAGAILASNTSTLDLDLLASFTDRPQSVIGLHFFSPATVMPLVEVVRGLATSAEALDAGVRFARAIGKTPVISGVCDGFIGNRMFEEYLRQAYFLLEEGALPAQVDAALEAWGMAMGPLRVMDLAGQDIGWKIRQRRRVDQPDRPYSRIPDLICEMGRFGQKTGAGFYRYEGRAALPDPEIDALIEAHWRSEGIERRQISDEEIVERCVFALVNEGAKILAEGVAQCASDIDMVYVHGYGFPAERGGPMFFAERVGFGRVLDRIRAFEQQRHGWAWRPADLLVTRAAEAGAQGNGQ